jgi:outer membrane immunogenic protein
MNKFLLALLAVVVPQTIASAADLPTRPRLASPVVDVGWLGMYAGINGGWNLGSFSPFVDAGPDSTKVNLDDNNPFVGGHIGYLYQSYGSNFVFGPEVGIQYWGFKSKDQVTMTTEVPTAVTFQQKIDFLAYANVRAGLALTPSLLAYVTGGAAWAHVKSEVRIDVADLAATAGKDNSVLGWNIGAGLEFKLSEYVSLGGEYRHYDFGKVNALDPILIAGFAGVGDKLTVDQVMGRFSYRFH